MTHCSSYAAFRSVRFILWPCSILRRFTGCCPNEELFERSLKWFLLINLGEVKEKRFQLFEPEGLVFADENEMNLRLICLLKFCGW
jgi:hypothetical protein